MHIIKLALYLNDYSNWYNSSAYVIHRQFATNAFSRPPRRYYHINFHVWCFGIEIGGKSYFNTQYINKPFRRKLLTEIITSYFVGMLYKKDGLENLSLAGKIDRDKESESSQKFAIYRR